MGVKVTNNAWGTLAAGITAGATSLSLTAGQGARFPVLAGGQWFWATLSDASNNLEIVKVTATSGDTFTVTRGQDDTTARAYNTSDRIELRPTAALFNDKADSDAFNTLNASNLTSGTVPLARLSGITNTEIDAAAGIAWTKISKTGSSLADLTTRSATDLSSGTLPDARFPATLPAASGVNLTSLNASNLASGTVASARISGGYTGITTVGTLSSLSVSGAVTLTNGDLYNYGYGSNVNQAVYRFNQSGSAYIHYTGSAFSSVGGDWTHSGSFTATGNITAYSDKRYKTDITLIPDALEKIRKVGGYTFVRTDLFGGPRQAGVLAQEIREVLPEVVDEDVTGTLSVAYGNISALLIQAIKELDARVEKLAKKVK